MPEQNRNTGILVLDKESGPTSHDVVAQVRRIVNERRVGHCGTLDPLATGVLVLCTGRFTRMNEWLSAGEKDYLVRLELGAASDTFDAQGVLTPIKKAGTPSLTDIEQGLRHFQGRIMQRPPAYSAIKVAGKRSYELARQNRAVPLAARPVTIRVLAVDRYEFPRLELQISCSRGTYVRTLANDLGELLGCGAYVSTLRRTRVGSMTLGMALSLAELEQAALKGELESCYVPPHKALSDLEQVELSDVQLDSFTHGKAISHPLPTNAANVCAVFNDHRDLFGIGEWHTEQELLKPLRVFRELAHAN